MTSWLLNFPNINLNIAEPIDEFVRYININYGEVFVAAKKMLSIFINGINGALDMIPWWLMILLVVFATKKLMNSYRNGIIYGGLLFMIGACGYWHMMNETLAIVITAVIFSLLMVCRSGSLWRRYAALIRSCGRYWTRCRRCRPLFI